MELSYINEPLPKIDRRLFLLVLLVTLGATFALYEFPVYFAGLIAVILFLAGVYNLPELGIAVLVNGLFLVGFFWRGLQITYLVTPLAVVVCTVGLTHYVLNHGLKWRFGVLPGIVLLIGVMLFVGILYSPLPLQGLVKAGKYLSMNLYIFFAAMLFINDLDKLKNLIKAIALVGMVVATVSIVYIACAGVGSITRFALPAQNPIWFARGMGMSLLATLFLLELTNKKLERFVYIFFISIMLFLLYTAGSRGPALALIASLFFYFFLLQRKRFNFLKKLFFFLLIFISVKLSVVIAPEHIWNRMLKLFSGFDPTTFYRLRFFEKAKNLFFENPLTGVGTAGFTHFTGLNYPHNIFLEFASELGIFGLLAFFILVFYAAYLGIKLLRGPNASALELSLSKIYLVLFLFSLINSQFSGAVWGNYELWFSVAGIWTLHSTRQKYLKK
ncbi:MAG: O-antigen ligase family protein [candidate division Zixibacteria bacterium]|nr:O-antigen ligase family protein [candidate division Zixibacteria bacterium]